MWGGRIGLVGPLCSQKFINKSTFGVQKWSKIEEEKNDFFDKRSCYHPFFSENPKKTPRSIFLVIFAHFWDFGTCKFQKIDFFRLKTDFFDKGPVTIRWLERGCGSVLGLFG